MPLLKRLLVYLFLFPSALLQAQFNYGHQMDFGKNRVQYQDFVWTYLDFERYRVYNYQGGSELGKYVAATAGKQLQALEKRLDYRLDEKINIIVYNNQVDFKQANLGLSLDEQSNTGGVTRIIGDKISVFFNGSHVDLDRQLRAAFAELLINKQLYGGSAREMFRNSTFLNLPPWYTQGLVRFMSEGWTTQHDNLLYDQFKNDNFSRFNRLNGEQAALAGHALWYYVVSSYGEAVVPNLLYMTRMQRTPDNAFITTLGVTQANLIYDFTDSYNRRLYLYRDSLRKSPIRNNSILKKYNSNLHYYQLKVNNDGSKVIYATNELNQVKVYLQTIENGSVKRLLKLGPKLEQVPDHNYPLLSWHPNGSMVAMIYPRRNELILHTIDLEENVVVKRVLPGFQKVNSFSYSPDGKRIVLSGVKRNKGQSDIFVFTTNSSALEQITNDSWDDSNPVFINGNKQIVFESNRTNDTLKQEDDANYFLRFNRNMDLFMAQYPSRSKVLVRVTETPEINETLPQAYGPRLLTFISDKNGIHNRYLADYDSSIAYVDTSEHYRYFFRAKAVSNNDRNILEQHISDDASHVAEVIYANNNRMLLLSPLPKLEQLNQREPEKTWYRTTINPWINDPSVFLVPKVPEAAAPKTTSKPELGIDFENYKFNGENQGKSVPAAVKSAKDSIEARKKQSFRFPVYSNYYTSFYLDQVVTQFDNSFMGQSYQVFTGGSSPIYLNPGFNFLTKISISDLFEDIRITGAFRFNFNLDNEFLLSFEQRKNRMDHQLVLDRQTFRQTTAVAADGVPYLSNIHTHIAKYSARYPFNPVSAVRASLVFRNDRAVPLSVSDNALTKRPAYENLAAVRLEYIYDNTRKVMLNIFNGWRLKVWTEYWSYLSPGNRDLFTSGFDVRNYKKIHRQITWCNRVAGGNSMGTDRLLFYMGGVDNQWGPSFNGNVNIVNPEQYGFQTLATNMRGFNQNIRNGNNFVLYNSELRIPVVRYFLSNAARSDFFNNLQVVGFADVGMAWYGLNPLSEENTKNINEYPETGTGVIVTVNSPKSPAVGALGFGLRTRLLGYFVRLDWGWGIDDGEFQDRVLAFSLTTDF